MGLDFKKHPILIVDDERENLDTFELNFGRKFNVVTASSGAEALELAENHELAVAISDQRMPEMTGTEFLAKLRKKSPQTVRMIVTGYTDIDAVVAAINEGAITRYIRKPWEAKDLEMIIRNALQQYERALERDRRTRELNAYNHILGMIAADLKVKSVVKEVLKLVTYEFGYDRVFLLLGDPAAGDQLKGQSLERDGDGKPTLRSLQVATDAAPIRPGGMSMETFTLEGRHEDEVKKFECAPFYAHPLTAGERTVGVFAAGYAKRPGQRVKRTDRDEGRLIATLATQMAVAVSRTTVEADGSRDRPTDRRARPRRLESEAPALDLKRYPVLVVDDEPENLDAFRMNFGNTFSVYTAASGEEGLEIYKTKPVSVIITDQRMPGMSGVELLAEAIQEDPDCVRVILTGFTDLQDVIDAVNRGLVFRYMQKPWNVAEMDAMMRTAISYYHELVEGRRLLREAEAVNRLMNLMLSGADEQRLVETVLRVTVEDLGHDRAYLFRYDDASAHLVGGQGMAREGESVPDVGRLKIPVIKGGGLLGQAALSDRPITSSQVRPDKPGGVEFVAPGAREFCAVAVSRGDDLIGVLAAERDEDNPRRMTPFEERTLTTMANQLAIALTAVKQA